MVAKSVIIDVMNKPPWNKGRTKETDASVNKISSTMKARGIDNFKVWRDKMKRMGKIKSSYPAFKRDRNLAEIIGVVLGDGHICVFPRTESLRIVGNSKNKEFIERYSHIVEEVFCKKPRVSKRKDSNATDITIYEKYISRRLGIPCGAREHMKTTVPEWIRKDRKFIIAYLRGLYEAEGSCHTHKKTYTHKLLFSNTNKSLLSIVFSLMRGLEFHPHASKNKIQISRKDEVQKAINLLQFRCYKNIKK